MSVPLHKRSDWDRYTTMKLHNVKEVCIIRLPNIRLSNLFMMFLCWSSIAYRKLSRTRRETFYSFSPLFCSMGFLGLYNAHFYGWFFFFFFFWQMLKSYSRTSIVWKKKKKSTRTTRKLMIILCYKEYNLEKFWGRVGIKEKKLIPNVSLRITVQLLWNLMGNFPSPVIWVELGPQDITITKQSLNW